VFPEIPIEEPEKGRLQHIRGCSAKEKDEEEIRKGWRRLFKEKLYGFYSSPNSICVIKLRRVKQAAERDLCEGRRRAHIWSLVGRSEERRSLG
jgi:hypothetical protein